MTVIRRRSLIAVVAGAVALALALTGCGLVESITGPKPLPKACDVLSEAEVSKIAGEDVSVSEDKVRHACQWKGDTIVAWLVLSRAEVEGFDGSKQEEIDKHGESVVIKGLGDDAYHRSEAEESVWIKVLSGDLVLGTTAQRKGPRADRSVAEALARAALKQL
ncbi:MAG: hypothetical protein GEU94_04350 [Micromonosporaceae bacterium]|nr:hypothetical protein [Micromonosporaceae bacterium]